ncbi:phosphotransferase [Actinomyces minihominis]|uniref:phosphotransferase n=1 Tax=Actinomyces minihominis TaxID=2002838 RepID=UPI000C0691C5|nr:phosphotransferase [Actinomyces minihominis]
MTTERYAPAPVTELELAALGAAAVPTLQVRGIRGPMRSSDSGQWLSLVDNGGGVWLAWAPSFAWTEQKDSRLHAIVEILRKASVAHAIPFTPAGIAGSVRRSGGGQVIVFEHPGGVELTDESLSEISLLPKSLGSSLACLHELDAPEYARASGQAANARQTRRALKGLVETHSSAIPARLRSRWLDALEDDSLWNFAAVPLHGSLSSENVFATPGGAVLGLSRFDGAAVGDPAQDLVWLMVNASDEFLRVFQAAYASGRATTDLHLLTRAQLLSELETLRWYARGVAAEDRVWRQQGVRALREMDEEIGDHRLVPHRPEVVEITFTVDEEPLLRLQPPSGGGSHQVESGGSRLGSESQLTEGTENATELISIVADEETGPYTPFHDARGGRRETPGSGSVEVP